jgi:NAD(P)-dependent dehydrogenase (short-subunit alcohol dehydrogenase family)/acyl carrier protein
VYLITGGLGALGLEVARALARTGTCPRLVLVGRTNRTDSDPRLAAALAELEALGAQVRVHAADVADRRAIARIVDTTTARLGPVNGVFHLAGVAGDGLVLFRSPAAVTEVLRPKVHGMVVLEEVFGQRPALDFLVSFSSRAGLDGLIGSGDYAAANAFLDAHAAVSDLARGRVTSVNWPSWAQVGMAARAADGPEPGVLRSETLLDPDAEPFLDEHRVDGVAVLPGTGILDLLVRSFRDVTGAEQLPPVQLTDVLLREPLACREPRTVVIEFVPLPQRWSFTIRSTPVSGGSPALHVTGDIEHVVKPAPTVDLAALLATLPERRPVPVSGPNRMFILGPRWRAAVGEFHREGDEDEKVVEIRLPEAFVGDLDRHPLHPSMLDVALSSARDDTRDGLCLPFMYRSLTVYGPLPQAVHACVERRPAADGLLLADIAVVDPDGRVLLQVQGFTMRRVQRDFLSASALAAAPVERDVPRGPEPLPAGGGIDPEVGARMTLDLLSSRPARQLAVRPFRDGRPVPLAGIVDVPVEPVVEPPHAASRAVIPTPRAAVETPQPTPVPAGDADIVERMRRLWSAVLGTTQIADDDNFFELGGNSLSAIDLAGMIRKELGIELNVAMLFDYPTLGGLAEQLRADPAVATAGH